MKRKGFTLIELLAVIVILGLLLVLIVPKVNVFIKNSKKKSYEASVRNLVQALNGLSIDKKANLIPFDGCSIDFDFDENTCDGLNLNGKMPTTGNISVDGDGNVVGSVAYNTDRFLVSKNNVQKDLLPLDYVHVNYIESTGTQYIDTGITYNSNNEYIIDCDVASTSSLVRYSGWNGGGLFGTGSSKWQNGVGYFTGNFDIYQRTSINIIIERELSSRSLMTVTQGDNSETITRTHSGILSYASLNYPIFAYTNSTGGFYDYMSMKLWGMKISINGTLVRDFVPCYRKSDNVAGLYDTVGNKFYTNSGTGEFLISD